MPIVSGCAAVERGGEDMLVVASYPLHAVTTPFARMQVRYAEDPRSAVVLSPLHVPLFVLEDTFFTGVHAVDAALTPLYAPFEVEPVGVYDLSSGVPRLRTEHVTGAEEDAILVFAHLAYVFAWIGPFVQGYGEPRSWPPPDCRP